MTQEIANSPTTLTQRLSALPMRAKIAAMIAIAAVIACASVIAMWAHTPDYKLLYSNLEDRDGGAIIAALTQMNVPYKFAEGGGAVLVPSDKVHEARLKLASQGLPKGGTVGYELMENQKFGATQFQEQVNYQRALEGELAKSIQSLAAVQSARVHIAIPKPSVFLRETQKPTASVLVNLNPGRALERAQVDGIMHLVSSSVAELPLKAVSVVDQNGTLLSGARDSTGGAQLDPSQLVYLHQTEQSYIKRIVDILEPIVGRDNVRAQVTADLDFSQTESTAEMYKPNQNSAEAAIRSQQSSESSNGSHGGAQGVPGALSNQPPGNASAPITGNGANASAPNAAANNAARKDSTVNYEVDKTVRYTRAPVGNIKRLSAAVVVNHLKVADKKGKATATALGPEQMKQINALVKEAMGFSEARGDSLNVVNAPFNVPEVEPVPETPLWKQPDNIAFAKQAGKMALVAALGLYLFFGVLRPLLKQLAATPRRTEPVAIPPQLELAEAGAAAVVKIDHLQAARQITKQDPKMVANIVKQWVAHE
jgi:flagellar M-ring protein FliF